MNSQVLIERELLQLAVGKPSKASQEENHKGIVARGTAQAKIRALLATPAHIPDAVADEQRHKAVMAIARVLESAGCSSMIYQAAWALVDAGCVSALQASSGVPDGWQLVPIEPTEKMLKGPRPDGYTFSVYNLYKAMLAAAPATGGDV